MGSTTLKQRLGESGATGLPVPEVPLARRLLAEGLGSFFLFATVIGSGVMAENLRAGNVAVALLGNTLATGAMLFVLITMLGPISGAHMNPAVSLVARSRRELDWSDAGAYTVVQLAFGILGAWAAHLMFDLPTLQLSVKARTGLGQWTGEAIATFGLILTIIGTVRHRPRVGPGQRRALHHRRLLVHLVHQLRQSGDHRRAQPFRQLRWHRAGRRAAVHPVAAGRRDPPPLRSAPICLLQGMPRLSRAAAEPPVLVLGLEHAVDLGDEVAQVEGLGQHLGVRRRAAALQRDRGEAGDEHHPDRRRRSARLSGPARCRPSRA